MLDTYRIVGVYFLNLLKKTQRPLWEVGGCVLKITVFCHYLRQIKFGCHPLINLSFQHGIFSDALKAA